MTTVDIIGKVLVSIGFMARTMPWIIMSREGQNKQEKI